MKRLLILAALVRDPELTYVGQGENKVAKFTATVAGEREIVDSQGNVRMLPFYDQVFALGRAAEAIARQGYTQGDVVLINGELEYDSWAGPDGGRRSALREKIILMRKVEGEHETVNDSGGGFRLVGGLNRAEVIGNMAADAELRHTPAGEPVMDLRLAVNETYTDRRGTKTTTPHWIKVTVWREAALALEHARKGDTVFVLGAMVDEKWTDAEGTPRFNKKIDGLEVALLSRTISDATPPARRTAAPARAKVPAGAKNQQNQNANRSGGLDIDQGDFPPEEHDLPF